MSSPFLRKSLLGFSALTLLALPGCFVNNYPREEAAQRIASPAWMVDREVDIGDYAIRVYERMHERYADGHIYIEGDGVTHTRHRTNRFRSYNPTPVNPVALHLAAHDNAENVAYIARPCQYTGMNKEEKVCGAELWGEARYSEEAVAIINDTINEIKARYNLRDIHLLGYDGGGAIAAILAAKRDDVASLRTVAGILDHNAFTSHHDVAPFTESLNPIDFADGLYNVPQHHYIGGQDEYVTPVVLHSYLQAVGQTNCIHYTYIQEAEHEAGFVEKWPDLLHDEPACTGPRRDFLLDPPSEIFFVEREKPEKP